MQEKGAVWDRTTHELRYEKPVAGELSHSSLGAQGCNVRTRQYGQQLQGCMDDSKGVVLEELLDVGRHDVTQQRL